MAYVLNIVNMVRNWVFFIYEVDIVQGKID